MQQLPWRHMDAITSQITMNRLIVQQLVRANNTENKSSASPTLCCVFPHRGPVRRNVFPYHIDGSVQEIRNSIANALELRLSCTNPSICPNGKPAATYMTAQLCTVTRFLIGCAILWTHTNRLKFISIRINSLALGQSTELSNPGKIVPNV